METAVSVFRGGAEQLQLVQAQFLVELDFIKFPPLLNSVCFRGIFARLTALADTCHVVHHIPVGLIYCIQFLEQKYG